MNPLSRLVDDLKKHLEADSKLKATIQRDVHCKTEKGGVNILVAIQGIDLIEDNPSCPHQRITLGMAVSSPSLMAEELYATVDRATELASTFEPSYGEMVTFQRWPNWGDLVLSRDGIAGAFVSVSMTGRIEIDWFRGSGGPG